MGTLGSFLTPFTNRVHLVTLVMCVILFCALRLSGGAVRVRNGAERNSSPQLTQTETQPRTATRKAETKTPLVIPDSEVSLDPRNELKQLGISDQMKDGSAEREPNQPSINDSDSLEAALNAKKVGNTANAKAANAGSGSSKDGLDDIEKRLGLK